MAETSTSGDKAPEPTSCQIYDATDPLQQEVSRILVNLQYDIMGVISLGKDGIMRSVTHDRKVLSAEPFSIPRPRPSCQVRRYTDCDIGPELVKAFLARFRGTDLEEWHKKIEDADGTKTPKEKWFKPDDDILPPPLQQERWDEVRNDTEEKKEVLRKLIREKEKYV
jgi:hypothetical protein